jgi:hypothetical protein
MISVAKLIAAAPSVASANPVELGNMIDRAVAFVQTQTRRYFGPVEGITEYVCGTGGRSLPLREVAVIDADSPLDSVEERQYPGADATVIDNTAYRVKTEDDESYLIRTDGLIWWAGYEYAVTYQHGYDLDMGPKDIESVIVGLVEIWMEAATGSDLKSETIGGYSYTKFDAASVATTIAAIPGAADTIAAWRRVVLA